MIKFHNNFLFDCEVFVTLEPCSHVGKTPSCANILSILKPKKIYIGSYDKNVVASGGIDILKKNGIKVEVGINQKECEDLLYPFNKWINDKFVFFKMAIRNDGSNDGIISSQKSFEFVHKIRANLDLLVIGGNTVRIDRPRLDARMVNAKASDILIYSKNKNFDKTIPLFNIPNRKVTISNKLDFKDKKFIMIEGGYNLYEVLKDKIDMLLLIISHSTKNSIDIKKHFGKTIVYRYFINDIDEIVFLR